MRVSSVVRSAYIKAFALLLGAAPLQLAAQMAHPTPAPILPVTWGSSADSVIAHATELGWHFLRVDGDGDYHFDANVLGERAMAYATFSARGLTRLVVSVAPRAAAGDIYRQLSDTLRSKYGFERLASGEERGLRAAPGFLRASAWQGILMGLRHDGWITLVFTCPESSPTIPHRSDGQARA